MRRDVECRFSMFNFFRLHEDPFRGWTPILSHGRCIVSAPWDGWRIIGSYYSNLLWNRSVFGKRIESRKSCEDLLSSLSLLGGSARVTCRATEDDLPEVRNFYKDGQGTRDDRNMNLVTLWDTQDERQWNRYNEIREQSYRFFFCMICTSAPHPRTWASVFRIAHRRQKAVWWSTWSIAGKPRMGIPAIHAAAMWSFVSDFADWADAAGSYGPSVL